MILNINQKAIARFNYASTDPKVLFFNENDEIIIKEQINKKWVKGKLVKNNIEGIFPLNYVKLQNPIDPKLDPKLKYQKNFNQETMEIFLTDLNPETSYLESALIKKQTVPLIKLYKPTRLPLFPFSRKGWLMIGSSNGKWKKKYCVLENLSLRYFPSEKENENEMKSIYIDKIMCVIRDSFQKTEKNSDSKTKANSNQKSKSKSKSNNKNDENFTFRIITKNQKNYHFQANSKKEMDDWINIICLFHDLLKFCSYSSTTEDIPTLKSLIQLMEIVYRRILEIKSKNNDQENEEIQTTSKTIELWMNLLLFKYYLVLKDKFNGESYAISIRDQESEAQHDLELRKYDYLKILFAKQEEKWIGKGEKSDGYFTQESIALLAFDSNQENGQKSDDKFDDEPLFFEGKETRNFVSNDLPEGFLINKALSILNYETKTNEFVIQKNGILCYETTQGWKKKYLILNNFYLNIYASDKEKNPEQTILLDKTTKIEKLQPKDKKNIFAISTKEYAIFKFYSTNLFVIQEWIQMIQISIYLLNIYEPINSENREIESKIHEIEELLKWIQESILNSEILISSLRKMENVGFFQNVSRRLSSSRKNEKNTILQDFQNQPFLQRPRQKIRKERSLLSTTSKNQTEEERRKTIENLLDLVDDEIAKEQNEESNSPQKNILKPGIVRLNTDKKVTKRNIYELERYRRRIPKTPTKNINDVSYYRNIRISSLFLEISLFKKIKRKLVKILGRLKFPNLSNDAFIGFTLSNTKIEPSNSSSHLNQKNILKHDIVKKQVLKKEIVKPQEIKKDEWFQIEIENENENQESRFLNIKYQNEIWQIEKSKVMNFKIESDFNVFKIDNNNNLSNSQDNETIQLKIDILELEKLKLTQKEAISPHSPLSKRVAPVRFTYSFLSDLETNSRSRIYSFNLNNLPRKKSIQLSHYYFEKWKQVNLNDEQQFPVHCSDSLLFLSNKKWITRWIMLNNWILSVNKSNYSPKPEKIYDLRDIISIKKEKSLFGQNNVLTIQMPDIIISLASEDSSNIQSWMDQVSALFNFIRFIASENNERKEEVDIIIYRLKSLLDWIQQQLKNYQKEKEEHETMIQLYKEIDSQTTFSFEKRIEICDYKTNHLIHWRKKILKRLLDTKLPERNRINFYGYIWKNFPQKLMKRKLDEKIITNYEKGDWIILNINNEKTKKFDLNELIHSDQEFIEGMIIRTKEKGSIFKKHVHLVEEIQVKKEEKKEETNKLQIISETKDSKEKEKEMAFDTESINEKEPPVHKTGAVYLSRSRLKLSSRWKIRSIEINGYNLNICHIDSKRVLVTISLEESSELSILDKNNPKIPNITSIPKCYQNNIIQLQANKQKILFAFSAEEEQKDWLQNFQILNYFLFLSNIVVEYNYTVSNNTDNKDGNHIHQNRNENLESIKKMYHNVEQRKELLYKSAFQNRHFTPFKQGQLRQFLNKEENLGYITHIRDWVDEQIRNTEEDVRVTKEMLSICQENNIEESIPIENERNLLLEQKRTLENWRKKILPILLRIYLKNNEDCKSKGYISTSKPKYQKENEPNENNSENENICEKKWVEIEEEIKVNIGNEMTKYKVKYEDKTEIVDENEIEIIIPAKIMQIKNFFANPIHEIQTIISTPKTSKTSKTGHKEVIDEDDGDVEDIESSIRRKQLFDMLISYESPILEFLIIKTNVADADLISKNLFLIFNSKNQVLELIEYAIKTEVEKTESEGTLFRANSVANKMMTNYSRLIVNEYMIHILQKPTQEIIELLSNYEGNPFEIYPNPDDRESFNKENIERIQIYAKKFLDSILDSISKVPLGLRYLCAKLNEITRQFFSESQYVAIGGLVFLRLICPTIVAPNVFGILDQKEKVTPKIRKALVVISKIIQSISNGCLFKESSELILLNEFVEESIPRLKGFMDLLIKPVYCLEPKSNDELNENVVVVDQKENDLVVFKVSENLSKCFLVSSNRFDLERKIIENIPIEKCSLPSKNEIESALDNIYNLIIIPQNEKSILSFLKEKTNGEEIFKQFKSLIHKK